MKKPLLLLLAILIFSCSAEDEASNRIVGIWQYHGITEFTEEGEAVEMAPAPCTQNSTLTFSNNGKLKSVEYFSNEIEECVLNEAATNDDLKWEEISEGTYRISSERTPGTEYEISFPANGTMWMVSGGSYERDGVNYSHRAYVYKKI